MGVTLLVVAAVVALVLIGAMNGFRALENLFR